MKPPQQPHRLRAQDLPQVRLTYHNTRAATDLAAGHVVCAIAKVANAYKAGADILRTFDPTGSIEFNKDTLAWKVEEQTVSINSACGRLKLRFLCSADQKELLHGKRGQADLLLRRGQFYLSVAVTVLIELNHWAFLQLKLFLAYKCHRAGVTLIEVDPRYSSQTCSGCGHCERGNRKSQERFECLCCGLKLNADVNAALNLKARGELSAALMFRLEALAFN